MTTCQEVGHALNSDDATDTCQRCGKIVKAFWPEKAMQTDKTMGLEYIGMDFGKPGSDRTILHIDIEAVRALKKSMRHSSVGGTPKYNHHVASWNTAIDAVLALTEQQEKE